MNFFGHAVVASWHDPTPGAVLGAMLPDFETMCGGRIARADDDAVARGIALHHATDAVFHQAAPVRALFAAARDRLYARGCRKGPTRAAAHVGVELLLDGLLLDGAGHVEAYLAALAIAPVPVTWRDPGDDTRFARLHQRLTAYGVPDDLRRPHAVAIRVFRTLAGHKLLAPGPDEQRAISNVLAEVAGLVAGELDAVMAAIRVGLAARAPGVAPVTATS